MDAQDFGSKDSEYFFIRVHGEQQLVTYRQLKKLVGNGSFSAENRVWTEETNKWLLAGEVEQLNDLFNPRNRTVELSKKKIYAVASGKGGVGKSMLS